MNSAFSPGLLLRKNAMIGWVALCALAAWLMPELGANGGPLAPAVTTKLAVALIFFLQGLLLPLEAIRSGLRAWRLHVLVQGAIFGLAPLLAWMLTQAAAPWLTPDLRMGLLFLGVLPTTVATAAALTAQVGGNVAGALFNTCLSNVAGIVLVPLGVAFFAGAGEGAMEFGPLMRSIAGQLLVPLLAGQALRPLLGAWAERHRKNIGRFNSGLIIFMLYVALCNAVRDRVWETGGLALVALAAAGAGTLLVAMTLLTALLARAWKFPAGDRAAAVFCGSQKTLAAGVPLASTIFGGAGVAGVALGIVILPLVFYHALQLTLGVILASRWEQAPLRPRS